MQELLTSLGTVVSENNAHFVIAVKWTSVKNLIYKYQFNRDPDQARVDEIVEVINNGEYVPAYIYVSEINNILYCYDGNHRRTAFLQADMPEDFTIILDVMFNASLQKTHDAFISVNLSVQVPEQYLTFEPDDTKNKIHDIVKKICKAYPQFVCAKPRYNRPHFNRDHLEDHIYNIYSQTLQARVDLNKLETAIYELNSHYASEEIAQEGPKRAREKCKKFGFYLFQYSKTIDLGHLKFILKKLDYI